LIYYKLKDLKSAISCFEEVLTNSLELKFKAYYYRIKLTDDYDNKQFLYETFILFWDSMKTDQQLTVSDIYIKFLSENHSYFKLSDFPTFEKCVINSSLDINSKIDILFVYYENLLRSKNDELAKLCLERIINLNLSILRKDKNNSKAYIQLAKCYEKLGKKEDSSINLEAAIALDEGSYIYKSKIIRHNKL
jgi:tetratricopeptide (TPR) repeat protein